MPILFICVLEFILFKQAIPRIPQELNLSISVEKASRHCLIEASESTKASALLNKLNKGAAIFFAKKDSYKYGFIKI